MAQLDEVSKVLGRLEEIANSHTELLQKMDNKLAEINGRVGKTENKVERMNDVLKVASVQANDWHESKKKAKWLVIGSGMAGAFGGFSISGLMSKILGVD
jgi:predicted  nucleic acid-binding Zn-ribbon protein